MRELDEAARVLPCKRRLHGDRPRQRTKDDLAHDFVNADQSLRQLGSSGRGDGSLLDEREPPPLVIDDAEAGGD